MIDSVGGYLPLGVDEFCDRLESGSEFMGVVHRDDNEKSTNREVRFLEEDRQRWHEDQGMLLFGRPYPTYQGWGKLDESPTRSLPTRFHLTRVNSNRREVLRLRGLAHRYAGDNRSAIEDFSQLLGAKEADGEVLVHRGLAKFTLGKLDEGFEDIAKGVGLGIDKDLLKLGQPRICTRPLTESRVGCKRMSCRTRQSANFSCYVDSTTCTQRCGVWRSVTSLKSMRINRTCTGERGRAWMGLENWQVAIADFSMRVESIDWYEDTHLNLAVAYALAGNFEAAYRAFRRADEMPYEAPIELHAAWLQVMLLDPDVTEAAITEQQDAVLSAINVALENISSQPRRVTGHQKLVMTATATSLSDLPKAIYENVLKLTAHLLAEEPTDPETVFAHALTLWRAENSKQAVELLRQLETTTAESSLNAKLLQSIVQQTLGDRNTAAEMFRAAESELHESGGTDRWQHLILQRLLHSWYQR